MSSGELLVIGLVAVIVFGPSKLPMLATHLGLFIKKLNQFKAQLSSFWQKQLDEIQLLENQRKAEEGERKYKNMELKD